MGTIQKIFDWVAGHHPLVAWVLAFVLTFVMCFVAFMILWSPLVILGLSSWSFGIISAIGCGIGTGLAEATITALRDQTPRGLPASDCSASLKLRNVPCPRCGRSNRWKQDGALVCCQSCSWWFEGKPPEYLSEKPVVTVGLDTLAVLFQGVNVNLDNALLIPDDGIRMAAVRAQNIKRPPMWEM